MSKKAKALIAIACLTAIVVIAVKFDFFHAYTLRDDNGGTIVWNSDEAYLFMRIVRRGYRISYAEYPMAVLMEWFGVVRHPSDQRVFLYVIQVTPSGVSRHLALTTGDTAGIPSSFTPMGQSVFTFCKGILCKWAGDHFEPATSAEQREVGGIEHLSSDSDTTVNGWSKMGIGNVAGDFKFSIQIGDQLKLQIRQGNVYKSSADSAVVTLERSGQPPEELWHINGQPRRVTRGQYLKALAW